MFEDLLAASVDVDSGLDKGLILQVVSVIAVVVLLMVGNKMLSKGGKVYLFGVVTGIILANVLNITF